MLKRYRISGTGAPTSMFDHSNNNVSINKGKGSSNKGSHSWGKLRYSGAQIIFYTREDWIIVESMFVYEKKD